MSGRDFTSPEYKCWRSKVYRRDHYQCKMPGCNGADKRLNAHHIRKWACFPALRFDVNNGITLCRTCHEKIKGLEEAHESVFLRLVNCGRGDAMLRILMMRYADP